MRVYNNEKAGLVSVKCNCCGRELLVENGILKEECVHIAHDFGFFGKRDGESQNFDLCEDCYFQIISKFSIPVETRERSELL